MPEENTLRSEKKCPICGEQKPIDRFRPDGKRTYCNICDSLEELREYVKSRKASAIDDENDNILAKLDEMIGE